MWEFCKKLYRTYLADQDSGLVLFILLLAAVVFYYLGAYLLPFFIAVFVAFLLNEVVTLLRNRGAPHILAVLVTFFIFLGVTSIIIFLILPLLWERSVAFLDAFPDIIQQISKWFYLLPESYPQFFSKEDIDGFINLVRQQIIDYGGGIVTSSLTSINQIVSFFIYCILVLAMVFFILKDYDKLMNYLAQFLPKEHKLMARLGKKMKAEMIRYIAGKLIEMAIVFVVSWIVFLVLGLNFSFLLAIAVGVSVIIPYVGAALVTFPVVLVAYAQFGAEGMFYYVVAAYLILQVLDGYVLVPLLFSELVNLHPVSVILAILIFGSLWGIWGVAFAIPLATFIKALFQYWPRVRNLN